MKTILVCGSREWTDKESIRRVLFEEASQRTILIIHGGARGADRLAGEIAKEQGFHVKVFYPDWEKYGKSAGFVRNKEMLVEGKPDEVIAFWDGKSRGTMHTINLAQGMNIPTTIIEHDALDDK